jgi:hypothetical protein
MTHVPGTFATLPRSPTSTPSRRPARNISTVRAPAGYLLASRVRITVRGPGRGVSDVAGFGAGTAGVGSEGGSERGRAMGAGARGEERGETRCICAVDANRSGECHLVTSVGHEAQVA